MQVQILDLFSKTATFDSFIPNNNEHVVNSLKSYSSQFTHLVGNSLSGKTHLLQAWVRHARSQKDTAIYIEALHDDSVNFRDIAKKFKYIALDNVEKLNGLQQVLLFDLFNEIKLGNLATFLLTSSHNPLKQVSQLRDDLKTRLLSGLNLQLRANSDDEIVASLVLYAAKEGIKIHDAEIKYLLNHTTRNLGVLITLIHRIADLAVLEDRNITLPLIKRAIAVS